MTLVTHTYSIEEILKGEYNGDHIDISFVTEWDDDERSHYKNALVVSDLSQKANDFLPGSGWFYANPTVGLYQIGYEYPLYQTKDGEWVTPFDDGLCFWLSTLNFNDKEAESADIVWSTWINKKGMPWVYK